MPAPRAASNYRQVLLTFTEESGGRVTVRVAVKPVNVAWNRRHTIIHESFIHKGELRSMVDVYALLSDYLSQPALPESHT